MPKIWRPFEDNCPECGDAAEVLTDSGKDNYVYDGDKARCMACHWPGSACIQEDDPAWIDWSDEPLEENDDE